jgi:glucokinase
MTLQNPQQTAVSRSNENALHAKLLGVDLGSHHIRLGVVDERGQLLSFRREPFTADPENMQNGRELAEQLLSAVQRVCDEVPEIAAIGVAFSGLIEKRTHRLVKLSHAPGLTAIDLYDEFCRAFNVPVHFENCANAAAFAEMQEGVARGLDDWLYLHLGANVSAGLILGGRLQRGHSGWAGAIGEMAIDPERTGDFVPLESLVSADNVVRRTRKRLRRDSTSSLSRLAAMGGYTYDDIIAAADAGDDLAILMLQRTGRFIGLAIAEVINLLNLSLVAVGGAPAARRFLVESIAAEAQQRASPIIYADCRIVPAELGAEAGVIGAALLSGQSS